MIKKWFFYPANVGIKPLSTRRVPPTSNGPLVRICQQNYFLQVAQISKGYLSLAVWNDSKFTLIFLGEFMCCGGYSYNMGYQDWKHTMLGGQFNSVPDSCCLKISNKCGQDIFRMTDQRRLVEQINTHGCITVMQRRLEDHVIVSF